MKKKDIKDLILVMVLAMALLFGNWIIFCGLVKLACLCFGWSFNLIVVSIIWLVIVAPWFLS